MEPPASLHTMVSAHAVGLSEMFRLAVNKIPLGKYKAEMTAPEGSTAGGALALQHIRIVPQEQRGHALLVGNANVTTSTAELRTLDYVEQLCLERFKEPLGIDPPAYAAFLEQAEAALQAFGLNVQRVGRPPPSILPPPTPSLAPRRSRAPLVVLILSGLVVAGALAWYFLR